MKKITTFFLLWLAIASTHAQIWTINSCSNLGSTTYGPMYSLATANSTNRMAVIYPANQLTNLAGQTLTSMYFQRSTATGVMAGTPNFKIYLKEVSQNDWGGGSVSWATISSGATLVYDSNPVSAVGNSSGWKSFLFTTNFVYSGTQNLAVFFEYTNATASTSISWNYEYTAPCSNTSNSNTSKYSNNTTGTLPVTLASSDFRRPLIGFDFLVSCPAPTNFVVNAITSSSANISWNAGGTETQWEYAVVPSSSGFPTSFITTTATSIPINSLTPNTNYSAYVRSNCGGTDGNSFWLGPLNFRTLCVPVTEYVENFDSSPTGVGNLPNCWNRLGTSTNLYTTTASNTPMSAPNRLYMNISASTTTYALLPAVSNLQANSHRLKFKAYCTSTNKNLRVGYLTNPTDLASFVVLQTIPMPSTALASTQEFTIIPLNIPVGIERLVLSPEEGVATTIYIDDVKWELNSTCLEPVSLSAGNITNNSASLSWTNGSTETAWNIQYGISGFTLGTGTIVSNVTSNPYILNGLLANTNYQYYVRATCDGNVQSPWAGPFTFKTQCNEVTEFSENFEGWATGSANPLPDCFTRLGTGSSYVTTGSTAPMSPANRLYFYASGTTGTEAYVVLPSVSNLQANTHRLKLKAYATLNPRLIEIGYLTNSNDFTTFVSLTELTIPGTTVAATQEFIYIPSGIPSGIKNLVLKNPGYPSSTSTIYIDDIVYEAIPSCLEVNSVSLGDITNNNAIVSWTNGGTETAWEIEYGAPGFVTGTGTVIQANTNPFTLTGLMANTNYQLIVRAVCSTNSISPSSGAINFKTKCNDATEFFENFDTSATGTTSPMPDCWAKIGSGTTYVTNGSTAPMSPSNRLYMNASGTAGTQICAILPNVSNLQSNTHRLKLKAYATANPRILEVGYLTDLNNASTFVTLTELTIPGITVALTQEFTIIPTGIPAGIKNLVLRNPGYPSSSSTIYIDDVKWEAIPTCIEPTSLTSNEITNNSITLNWTNGASETSWEIEYGLSGFSLGTGTIVAASSNPFTISTLTSNTNYQFYVRAVCSATSSSLWTGPFTAKTLCDDVTNYFYDFEGLPTGASSAMPDCWNKLGTGSVYLTTGSVAPMSPVNRLYMFASGTSGTESLAILPPVSNLQANTHRLKFMAYATLANRTLQIGYLTNPANANSFVQLTEITLPGTTAATAQEFTYAPIGIPVGVKNLVIKNPGFPASSTTAYVDNVRWEPNPVSVPNCASNVTATPNASCGNYATIFSWDVTSLADGYYITIGTASGLSDVLNNQDVGNVTNYSFIGNVNTTYYYKVTPYNTTGTASACTEFTFTTVSTPCYCSPIYTTGITSNDLISNVVISGTSLANNSGTVNSGPFYTYFTGQPNLTADLQRGNNYQMAVSVGTTGTQHVSVWIDYNDNYTFEESERVAFTTTSIAANGTANLNFTINCNTPLGSHRMRVRSVFNTPGNTIHPCNSYGFGETEDYMISIVNVPLPTGDSLQTVSVDNASEATLEDLIITPSNVIWFATESDALANSNPLPLTTQLINNTTYYAVVVSNGCLSNPLGITVTVVLSNEVFVSKLFKSYPNPFQDIITLESLSVISEIKIYDFMGKQVYHRNINALSESINLSKLIAGTYLLKVYFGEIENVIKIVKK